MIALQIICNFGFLRTHLKANICTCNGYYIYLNKSYFIHYKNQALENFIQNVEHACWKDICDFWTLDGSFQMYSFRMMHFMQIWKVHVLAWCISVMYIWSLEVLRPASVERCVRCGPLSCPGDCGGGGGSPDYSPESLRPPRDRLSMSDTVITPFFLLWKKKR